MFETNRASSRLSPPRTLVRWGDADLLSAWLLAERLHRGQLRKNSSLPYITHPFAVCRLLRHFGASRHIQIAALLHDAVEDRDASLIQISERFSPEVARVVMQCSRVTTAADGTRARRHAIELVRMRTMDSDSQSLKLADICHNGLTVVRRDPRFAAVYIPEKKAELDALRAPSVPTLLVLADRIIQRAEKSLKANTPLTPDLLSLTPQMLQPMNLRSEPGVSRKPHQHHQAQAV